MGELVGLLGGAAGFSMENQSASSQSTPFYNDSGIYFNSPGAGTITAGDTDSSATPTRATGAAPVSASSQDASPFDLPVGSGSIIPWVVAVLAALILAAVLLFKK